MTTASAGVSAPRQGVPDGPADGEQQSKYTVMMSPRSVAAMREAAKTNHETRTNVINRGVQLYLLVTRLINNGWTIAARDKDGREQLITLL